MTKIDNSELLIFTQFVPHCHFQAIPCVIEKFRLIVFALYIKGITRVSPEFSELSLWPDAQSSDIWSIPPSLEVLPLAQKYQTEQKDFA